MVEPIEKAYAGATGLLTSAGDADRTVPGSGPPPLDGAAGPACAPAYAEGAPASAAYAAPISASMKGCASISAMSTAAEKGRISEYRP